MRELNIHLILTRALVRCGLVLGGGIFSFWLVAKIALFRVLCDAVGYNGISINLISLREICLTVKFQRLWLCKLKTYFLLLLGVVIKPHLHYPTVLVASFGVSVLASWQLTEARCPQNWLCRSHCLLLRWLVWHCPVEIYVVTCTIVEMLNIRL